MPDESKKDKRDRRIQTIMKKITDHPDAERNTDLQILHNNLLNAEKRFFYFSKIKEIMTNPQNLADEDIQFLFKQFIEFESEYSDLLEELILYVSQNIP